MKADVKLNPPENAPTPFEALAALHDTEETAWLETMARLAADRCSDEVDYVHLSVFLTDMARRDKREALHRLTSLLMHLLTWEHQPSHRSSSWQRTIVEQRAELSDLLESGTLRDDAEDVLSKAYGRAVKLAAIETGLDEAVFPQSCPFALDDVIGED